jgi:hypothetical protein
MTDVQQIESPTSEESASPRRRRRARATGSTTSTTRRARLRGNDLVESLRESVEQLIKENRSLKRQLSRAMAGGGSSSAPGAERTLRSIQRKVMRAVGGDASPRRRTRTTSTATSRKRTTSTRRRAADSRSG